MKNNNLTTIGLSVGNNLLKISDNTICIVTSDILSEIDNNTYHDYAPKKLTNTLLEDVGLKKEKVSGIGGADMWQGMGAYSYKNEWLFRGDYRCLHLVGYFNTNFMYVHQIQNMIYQLYTEMNTL